ncbi:hypothetical protein EOM39_05080 [Candidatus Gracilibacteria bacterium]|nr:hypothetical protein [Candidatus Gracilibacteria bacterium]
MFINNISKFLPNYKDYKKSEFKKILSWANKGFDAYKIEKDFLLTLILIKFGEKYPDLIFKGGTCLNKIYFPYFRLSEDLDFVIDLDISRAKRQTLLKKYENNFVEDLGLLGLNLKLERTKFDEHKMAIFTFEYDSVINNSTQHIKIDISLKNNLELPVFPGKIQSIFIDKILEKPIFGDHYINCIDLKESIAEKMRASLTRITPAIRDFFDIWYVKNNSDFDFQDREFKKLLDIKLQEVGYAYTLQDSFDLLEKQIKTDLKPVLNEDFAFDFPSIYDFIMSFKV